MKKLLTLFLTFLKIGAFTFGGGYAMIALLENEFITKRGWLSRSEFLDMAAIAESTPGPIAINSATYIGYRLAGVSGALAATAAVCIPSFVIIYVISLFFDRFLSLNIVFCAFRGIQVCVIYLILTAALRLLKGIRRNAFNICVIAATAAAMIGFSAFAVSFSTVFYILISGAAGIFVYLIGKMKSGGGK